MWRFVLRENVVRFRALLRDAPDGERQLRQAQLAAAERELSDLEAASAVALAAKDAGLSALLTNALRSTVTASGADFGYVQLFETETEQLQIAAQVNLRTRFLDHVAVVTAHDRSTCGRALQDGHSVWLSDVEEDDDYAASREIARETGYRAASSIPLPGHHGAPLGMISLLYRAPRQWSDGDRTRAELMAASLARELQSVIPHADAMVSLRSWNA